MNLNKNLIENIYKKMSLIRNYELKIIQEYPKNLMRCPVHLSIGQEAIPSGIFEAMSNRDICMSNHRAHAHYLAKGCNVLEMTNEIYGKKDGCSGGKGGSMHLIDLNKNFYGSTPIVASTIPILTGIAFGDKLKKINDRICIVFFGDGAFESGNFHETINFASTNKLKVLFICENNFYSVYSSLKERQPTNNNISKYAKSHKIESLRIDGNKADEIYKVAKSVRSNIIKKSSPILIELLTYRHFEHCGPNKDDQLGYRDKKELNKWLKRCPIEYFKAKYSGLLKNFENIDRNNIKFINQIFNKSISNPYPKKTDLNKNLYAI